MKPTELAAFVASLSQPGPIDVSDELRALARRAVAARELPLPDDWAEQLAEAIIAGAESDTQEADPWLL